MRTSRFSCRRVSLLGRPGENRTLRASAPCRSHAFRHRITELAAHLMRRATSFRDNSARRSFSARLRRSDSKSAEPLGRTGTSSHAGSYYCIILCESNSRSSWARGSPRLLGLVHKPFSSRHRNQTSRAKVLPLAASQCGILYQSALGGLPAKLSFPAPPHPEFEPHSQGEFKESGGLGQEMSTLAEVPPTTKSKREVIDRAVIRFAGDSGDGMQITGSQFTNTVALYGNDIATFPDYPAEIRAPAGTIPGVSGFQLHCSSNEVFTPGDAIDALIAMNPAALKVNIADLKANGILIVNSDSFKEADLRKAQLTVSPLEDHSLDKFRVFAVELQRLTRTALQHLGLDAKTMDRCKNFFALGMCYWLYNRSTDPTMRWIEQKFNKKPLLMEANKLALKAGYSYCEATEAFQISYEIPPAQLTPGVYRNVSGNQALAMGFVTAAQKAGLNLFLGSYPITPASDILHELSQYKNFGVTTFQAEDEIAAITSAIGASYAGLLAITTTSGPGMALKTEALGLAVMTEIPVVICDIQRGGPSTGLRSEEHTSELQSRFD